MEKGRGRIIAITMGKQIGREMWCGGGAGVAEAAVPQVGGDRERRRRGAAIVAEEGVQVAEAIGPHEESPSC
jgi:hypothetical protein